MLHDVSKDSADRSNPQPNRHDQLASESVKAHGTNSVNYTTDATGEPNTYVVQTGDDIHSIATAFGLTTDQLEALNPDAGHPPGNFSLIYPGDVLTVSSNNTGIAGGGNTVVSGFKRLVLTCPVPVVNDGSPLTTASLPHGLNFVPIVEAALENANSSTAGGIVTGVSLPLPTFTGVSLATSSDIEFFTWLYAFADDTNVYVNFLNTTGIPISLEVTCYLYQRITS